MVGLAKASWTFALLVFYLSMRSLGGFLMSNCTARFLLMITELASLAIIVFRVQKASKDSGLVIKTNDNTKQKLNTDIKQMG